jgi:hypothetical protein
VNVDEREAMWAAETLRMAQEGRRLLRDERDRCADHSEHFTTNPDQLMLTWSQEPSQILRKDMK